jgi:hypothetical protein
VTGWYDSAIDGGDGNREFFVQALKPLEDWRDRINKRKLGAN